MFVLRDESGRPIKNFSYKMILDNGDVHYGKTNAKGETLRIGTGARVGIIKLMPDDRE
jgi:type VI secretion system secreted protein VgrG